MNWRSLVSQAIGLLAATDHRARKRRARIEAKLDAIAKAGEPVTLAELDEWYAEPPPAENAAHLYTQAFSALSLPEADTPGFADLPVLGGAALPELGVPLPSAMKQAITKVLTLNQAALALLHQGAALKKCRYPVDLRAGFMATMPHLLGLKQSVQLLELECLLHAEDGQLDLAVQSLLHSVALSRSLEEEPVPIAQLVRLAGEGISVSGCQALLRRRALSADQLAALQSAFREAEAASRLTRAMAGERCMAIDRCRSPAAQQIWLMNTRKFEGPAAAEPLPDYIKRGKLEEDLLFLLEFMEAYIAVNRDPDTFGAAAGLVRRFPEQAAGNSTSLSYFLLQIGRRYSFFSVM